jgi:hypothetical protein
MRYCETDQLHLDFHGATQVTIDFLAERFGVEAMQEVLFRTGRDVYRSIRSGLSSGDSSELVEHWRHFLTREEGVYGIHDEDDEIVLTVEECPAVRQILKLGMTPSPYFCHQTVHVSRGMCDGTPFEIVVEKTGPCSCRQTLRKRCSGGARHDSE